jgi:hypothetical protein
MEVNLLAPKPPPGGPAGGPPAGGAGAPVGAGAGAATVTPVLTASPAGIEDRPGTKLGIWVVKMTASPTGQGHCPPMGGGLPPPHQHPGGEFCH